MNLYVYCPRRSTGALELVKAMGAHRLRKFDGLNFWNKRTRVKLSPNDIVVCWGSAVPEIDEVRVLNASDKSVTKYDEIYTLAQAGVPTIAYSKGGRNKYSGDAVFLPRINFHQEGRDLIYPPERPDFYTIKENFVKEYRIHSFDGRSIRAGVKVPREGFKATTEANWKPNSGLLHPWIRSYDCGWKINYDGFQSTAKLRKVAHTAVAALGLTFGAVDIGELPDGTLKVLEVNRAPGIEGGSIQTYVRAITRWIEGRKEKKNDAGGAGAGV